MLFKIRSLSIRLISVAVAATFALSSTAVYAEELPDDSVVIESQEESEEPANIEEAADTVEESVDEPAGVLFIVEPQATGSQEIEESTEEPETEENIEETETEETVDAEGSETTEALIDEGADVAETAAAAVTETEPLAGEAGDAGAETDTKVKASDIVITITSKNDGGGCDTYREYTFYNRNDASQTAYTCYVYGSGVTDAMCSEFAAAYLNTGSGAQRIVNENFTDSNKSSILKDDGTYDYNEGYDSEHCWLKASADTLYASGWMNYADAGIFNVNGNAAYYFSDEDAIGDYLSYCFTNEGGSEDLVYDWLFDGDAGNYASCLKYGEDENDALLYAYNIFKAMVCYSYFSGNQTLSGALNNLKKNHAAASMGIYFFVNEECKGGHAVSLNGYILDSAGTPVGVILADPDDSVKTGPEDPADKDKMYAVNNLKLVSDGTYTEFPSSVYNIYSYRNTSQIDNLILDITELKKASSSMKVADSLAPESTSALRTALSSDQTYDIYDYLNVALDYDFLNFYDIVDLKYDLYDSNGNKISADGSKFSYSKATWQSLLDSDSDFSLNFTDIINTYGAGNYELKLSIDPDCFYGNFGWFAKKFNNGAGYMDTLADVWINLLIRQIQEEASTDSSDSTDSYYEAMNQILEQMVQQVAVDYSAIDATANANNTAITVSLRNASGNMNQPVVNHSAAETKREIKNMISDMVRANAGDASLQAAFREMGVSYSDLTSSKVSVLMSSAVSTSQKTTITLNAKNIKNLSTAKLMSMVTTKDGRRVYIKARVNKNGTITFDIPAGATSVLLVSFAQK